MMEDAVLKYIITPFIAAIGVYVVGSVLFQLFGIPTIVLLGAVGGVAFFAKFYR